jgi:hypothetical protein
MQKAGKKGAGSGWHAWNAWCIVQLCRCCGMPPQYCLGCCRSFLLHLCEEVLSQRINAIADPAQFILQTVQLSNQQHHKMASVACSSNVAGSPMTQLWLLTVYSMFCIMHVKMMM